MVLWKMRTRNAAVMEAEREVVVAERDAAVVAAREAEAKAAPPQADPVPVELATVSVRQAERLRGHPVLVTFDLLDNDDGRGGFTVYSNEGPDSDGEDVERSVWVPKGKWVPRAEVVVGTFFVIRHAPDRGDDGTTFPGDIEVRVVLDP